MAAVRVVLDGLASEPGAAGKRTSETQIINLDAGFAVDI
jgi:hypothetical protein